MATIDTSSVQKWELTKRAPSESGLQRQELRLVTGSIRRSSMCDRRVCLMSRCFTSSKTHSTCSFEDVSYFTHACCYYRLFVPAPSRDELREIFAASPAILLLSRSYTAPAWSVSMKPVSRPPTAAQTSFRTPRPFSSLQKHDFSQLLQPLKAMRQQLLTFRPKQVT